METPVPTPTPDPETYTLTFTGLTAVQLKRLEMAIIFEGERRVAEIEAILARPLIRRSPDLTALKQADLARIQADFQLLYDQLHAQFPGLFKVIG